MILAELAGRILPLQPGDEGVQNSIHLELRQGHDAAVQLAQESLPGLRFPSRRAQLLRESGKYRREFRLRPKDFEHFLQGPEPVQHPEVCEHRVDLGLVVLIAVRAVRGIDRDSCRVFPGESLLRLGP
jgi:hypothetical protein